MSHFRRFAVYLPISNERAAELVTNGGANTVRRFTVKNVNSWHQETEILLPLNLIARIIPSDSPFPWIVLRDGTSWLSAIEYKFLADALDGMKTLS